MTMKVLFAYQTGESHRQTDTPCQDYADGFYDDSRGVGVVALADGAGSYPRSALAAKAAVDAVLAHFRNEDTLTDKAAFVRGLNQAVSAVSLEKGDARTTLLFAALTREGFVAGHIGDGAILVRQEGHFSILSQPENGAFSWETYLLPCREDSARFRLYRGEKAEGFLLSSDGISYQLVEPDGRCCPACEKLFNWCASMTEDEFRETMRQHFDGIFAQYSDDDKSIAMIRVEN